jgi:hypothetical protein
LTRWRLSRDLQSACYACPDATSPPATAAACAARQHSSGAGSAERHNAAAPGSRTAAGGPPRAAAAPAAARQQKQRVSAGFSCVFFFWRGLRRTVAFVAGAGAVSVCWRTWQEEQRQATTRAAPVAAPKETGRSTSGNPRSRRPRRHHRSTRRTRESRSPAPAPPPPWLPGRRRTTHWSRTGTGDRRSNTSARDSGNARKSRQTPAGSRSSAYARRAARPRTGARQRRAEAGRPRIYGNRSNGSPQTLPVFFFFWRGLRKPVALVASPLCVLAGRNGESDHASPREKRAGTESANGSPLPVSAASRRPVEKVPGFNAGGREPVSELRVLGSRWLYLLLWPPRRKSLA